MTKKAKLAEIQRIIEENARLLGEEPVLYATAQGKGWIRIGHRRGTLLNRLQPPRFYPNIDEALEAARMANARANRVAFLTASGMSTGEAVARTAR